MWATLRDLFNSVFGNNYPPEHQLVSLRIRAKQAAVTKADLGAKQTADLNAKQKKVTTVALMEADWEDESRIIHLRRQPSLVCWTETHPQGSMCVTTYTPDHQEF